MGDLLKWLRDGPSIGVADIYERAAERIEQLEAELKKARIQLDGAITLGSKTQATIERVRGLGEKWRTQDTWGELPEHIGQSHPYADELQALLDKDAKHHSEHPKSKKS